MEDVRKILWDHKNYSNRAHAIGSRPDAFRARLRPHELQAFDELTAFEELIISRTDGDQHQRLRAIVHRAFNPQAIATLEELVGVFTRQLFDDMVASGATDIASAVTRNLPVMMICALLNVPQSEAPLIQGWSARIGKNRGQGVVADLMDAHDALMEFRDYVREKIELLRLDPKSTNLVSTLMGASDEERLSEDELVAMVLILLFAGADTTKALLGNGTHVFLSNPDQWRLFLADSQGRLGGATDELIRYIAPVQTLWRVTTAPVRIQDLEVEPGTTILLLMGAANRDPAVFEEPDRFDITREESRPHVSFGFGTHFCLGTHLAQMECRAYFGELATRFPEVKLTQDPDSVTFGGNIQFRTVTGLQVALGAGRSG
ncbi:MAG: cytochrome P450 [Hyphomonadaceae bacterium]|nr:cytochrome P450 [Hyphomonadaceae bacterium]